MTETEFNDWVTYHTDRFPTMRDKFSDNPVTLATWPAVMERVSLAESKSVTDAMQLGTLDHPKLYEWDRLPSLVVAEIYARRHFDQRKTVDDPQAASGAWKTVTGDGSMGAAYREYLRMLDAGHSHEECSKRVREMLGASQ